MKTHSYLSKCVGLIEEKLNWGDRNQWIDYNFKTLSDQIYQVSNITISIRTLKRIFKPANTTEASYEPQIATKNALAQFLGYRDWMHFVNEYFQEPGESNGQPAPAAVSGNDPIAPVAVEAGRKPARKRIIRLIIAGSVLLLAVGFMIARGKKKVAFSVIKTGGADSHNAALSYDISSINFDNAIIDFDNGQFKSLSSKKGELVFSYKTPNFYRIKLISDGKIRSTAEMEIPSNGWVCYIGNNDANARVIEDRRLFTKDGALYFPPAEIAKINIDTTSEYWADYRNIKDFHLDGDNFIMELRLKNSKQTGGVDCFDTCIEWVGETGKGRYKFVRPNCTEYADAQFGDMQVSGSFHNLSALGTDLSNWTTIRIEVKDKQGMVFVNNHPKYALKYNTPIGDVRGIFCRFKGSGALDYVKIYNLNKQLVYDDEFNAAD
ncbi:MAG: hypothetical protein J7539_00115 [Niabella sp.]|nr:hypothetical protein [Niabella sp.]